MNILYISHLSKKPWAGPTYSVPAQIAAQSKIDNVFWYNITKSELAKQWKFFPYYHDVDEFPGQQISLLPEPFNKPDIVVVEQFYNMARCPILKELINGRTPYVIIPRCELTREAQKRKRIKKFFANLFCFRKFAYKAAAIHYLTEQEKESSGKSWNKKSYVIPNGIDVPARGEKKEFSKNGIKCVSIGRLEPYQKGLDLLVDAVSLAQDQLRDASVSIALYGPDVDGKADEVKKMIVAKCVEDIIKIYPPVFGEEKVKVLKENDVFLMPSRFEGHPMALIEAMAHGLPCVVTPGSNMYNEIMQNNAGWCAKGDANSLAQSLLTVLKEKEIFYQKSMHAIELAREYDWFSLAKKQKELFEILV